MINARKQRNETGSCPDALLNSSSLDSLAVNGVSTIEVDGAHGQLALDLFCHGLPSIPEHQIILPLHKVTEPKVVQLAAMNCPKAGGSSHGSGKCLACSLDARSRRSS